MGASFFLRPTTEVGVVQREYWDKLWKGIDTEDQGKVPVAIFFELVERIIPSHEVCMHSFLYRGTLHARFIKAIFFFFFWFPAHCELRSLS